MAHEFESGFFVSKGAWHGLGTTLAAPPTVADGLQKAGLDWKVRLTELTAYDGMRGQDLKVPSHRAVMRESDASILGVVGADYAPVQNDEAFAFFDPLISQGVAELETAGSLRGGRRVWVMAKLKEATAAVVGDDVVDPYLLLSTSHDGSRAVTVAYTAVRVVCMNTLSAAERQVDRGHKASISVRHIGRPQEALRRVSAFVDVARRTFALSLEEWRAMRGKAMSVSGLETYINRVLRDDDAQEERVLWAEELATVEGLIDAVHIGGNGGQRIALMERAGELRAKLASKPRAMDDIIQAFEAGPGAEMAGETVWGAFNALTHWVDHTRGRSEESRLEASWHGAGATLRERARTEALALL